MNAGSSIRPAAEATARTAPGALLVFLAALGPMTTVTALRRLLVEVHGGTPAHVHAFVAIGMIGAAIGAPLLAMRADRHGGHLRLGAMLAAADAVVAFLTVAHVPTALVFALRPIHGAASMGLLALLFARFRGSSTRLASRAGAAMVAALAIGPGLGGALGRHGVTLPFHLAAALSAVLAVVLASSASSEAAPASAAPREPAMGLLRRAAAPLAVVGIQRFAIGGFVAAFAVQARAAHGMSDAAVGASFSTVLVVFALALAASERYAIETSRAVALGGVLFGGAFVALATAPRGALPMALVVAGVGAALMYGPSLALVSALAPARGRATAMALLHACGAAGMIAGPLVAAALDLALHGHAVASRSGAFLAAAGVLAAAVSLGVARRCGALARTPR